MTPSKRRTKFLGLPHGVSGGSGLDLERWRSRDYCRLSPATELAGNRSFTVDSLACEARETARRPKMGLPVRPFGLLHKSG
jgi:hypothetical protein